MTHSAEVVHGAPKAIAAEKPCRVGEPLLSEGRQSRKQTTALLKEPFLEECAYREACLTSMERLFTPSAQTDTEEIKLRGKGRE